jgi:hypothetical protein
MELCNCEMLCPCWLGPEGPPDQGWCGGAFAFDIREGNSDGVDLGGTKVAFTGEWPGNFFAGNGTLRVYVDEGASADQRRELEAIFGGNKGGHLQGLWDAVMTKRLPARTEKIQIQWGDSPSLTVGNIGQARLQPIRTRQGGPRAPQALPRRPGSRLTAWTSRAAKAVAGPIRICAHGKAIPERCTRSIGAHERLMRSDMQSLPPLVGSLRVRSRRRKASSSCLRCALTYGPLMRRSLIVALIVGTVLTAINEGNIILRGDFPDSLYWKIPLGTSCHTASRQLGRF